MTFIVGITGGIGSGKSAATAWFEQQGIQVIDADVVAREVVALGQPALTQIRAAFGDWALLSNGELDRRALRDYIFNHPDARQTLEQITHPIIRQSMIEQLHKATSPYVILVSPLLFETTQHHLTHHNVLIDVPEHLQIERAMQRDQQSIQNIQNIISAQMPRTKKQALAHDIVINDADLKHLYAQLASLHQKFLLQADQHHSL